LLVNVTRNKCLATKLRIADSFFSRLKGLLGTDCLLEGTALLITPCSSVHAFGMTYPLDVLFIGVDHKVLKIATSLRPGRIAWCGKGRYVVELPAGAIEASQTQVGDEIRLICSSDENPV